MLGNSFIGKLQEQSFFLFFFLFFFPFFNRTFLDASIKMHTGFSLMGLGSMFGKEKAIDFLDDLKKMQVSSDLVDASDSFFPYFQNQFPRIYLQHLVAAEGSGAAERAEATISAPKHYESRMFGVQSLRKRLKEDPKLDIGSPAAPRRFAYNAKARATFISSVLPVDIQKAVDWEKDKDRGKFETVPAMAQTYASHNALHAFDDACWETEILGANEYFGFDLTDVLGNVTEVIVQTKLDKWQARSLKFEVRESMKSDWKAVDASLATSKSTELLWRFKSTKIKSFRMVTLGDFYGSLSCCGFTVKSD